MSKSSTATRRGSASSTPNVILAPRIALMVLVGILLLFGLVMQYSSSSVLSYYKASDSSALFVKQLGFAVMGVVACIVIALTDYHFIIDKLAKFAWVGSVILLVATLIFGSDDLGAKRSIDIGIVELQPSEIAKITIMIILVQLVEHVHDRGLSKPLVITTAFAILVPIGLIAAEPDLGTTVIAAVGILAVLWFGGIPKKYIAIIIAITAVFGVAMIWIESFRQSRLSAFLDPYADPLGSGYQILNSYYAFGDGGLLGVGLGLSRQKYSYLPEAHNDFIFAIIGEELGLLGALAVLVLFLGFLYAAFAIARNAPDISGVMLAGSAAVIIGFQAFLNMLCVVGAAPITGKSLPFFSAGGTSMITTMMLVGLIFSVSMRSKQLTVHERRREELLIINGGGGRNANNKIAEMPARKPAAAKLPLQLPALVPAALEKVVPISRARAAQNLKQSQASKKVAGNRLGNKPTADLRPEALSKLKSKPAARSVAKPTTRAANKPAARQSQPAISMSALRKNRTGLANKYTQHDNPNPNADRTKRQRGQGGAA